MKTLRICCFLAIATIVLPVLCSLSVAAASTDLGVASSTGIVVSNSGIAADIGASILRQGGNAVDAAVANLFAQAVTNPGAGNIGGGGFMLIRMASGKVAAIDYREMAPHSASPKMYIGADGKLDSAVASSPAEPGNNPSVHGYRGVAVPGTVSGLWLAHKTFGKLPWKDVVMPAARLATDGFALTPGLAQSLNAGLAGPMKAFSSTVEAYGKPGGGQWVAGDRLVLPDLGKTLAAIANQGGDVFYKGWIADRIVADMKAHGGLITKEDLAAYQAKMRVPLTTTFHGYEVIASPPASSGIVLIEMLNILENFDLKPQSRYSPETLSLMIEAMRRGYLDRARYLGDPDFNDMPVARLTSKSYAKTLADAIPRDKASNSLKLGSDLLSPGDNEGPQTTTIAVIDKNGNAVSNTYTLMDGYGSKIVVQGAGFFLNNEMGSFNITPGNNGTDGNLGTKPNQIEPLKRPLTSMMPTMVTQNGKLVLVTGAPGARTIINTVFEVVLNVTEFGMNGREAVDAPRMDHEWLPDVTTFEPGGIPEAAQTKLEEMGYKLKQKRNQGIANSVWVNPATGIAYGENDNRGSDTKAAK
jgi:gamma-glutamyltranspeptidase / glutathione hydrolase